MITCIEGHSHFTQGSFCSRCEAIYCSVEIDSKCRFDKSDLLPFKIRKESIAGDEVFWVEFNCVKPFGLVDFDTIPKEPLTMMQSVQMDSVKQLMEPIIFKTRRHSIEFLNKLLGYEAREKGRTSSFELERFTGIVYNGRSLLLLNHSANAESVASIFLIIESSILSKSERLMSFLSYSLAGEVGNILKRVGERFEIDLSSDEALKGVLGDVISRRITTSLATNSRITELVSEKSFGHIKVYIDGKLALIRSDLVQAPFYVNLIDAMGFFIVLFDLLELSQAVRNSPLETYLRKSIEDLEVEVKTHKPQATVLFNCFRQVTESVERVNQGDTDLEKLILASRSIVRYLSSLPDRFFWATSVNVIVTSVIMYYSRPFQVPYKPITLSGFPFELHRILGEVTSHGELDPATKLKLSMIYIGLSMQRIRLTWDLATCHTIINSINSALRTLEENFIFIENYAAYQMEIVSDPSTVINPLEHYGDLISNLVTLSRYASAYGKRSIAVIMEGSKVLELMNVTYASSGETVPAREISGILLAGEELKCPKKRIITWDYFENGEIEFTPLWKWLLETELE